MQMDGGFPESHATFLRSQDAALPSSEESFVLACAQGNSGAPAVAKEMRRLFGPRGDAARQDVLVAADIAWPWGKETDFDARAAYSKAKKGK